MAVSTTDASSTTIIISSTAANDTNSTVLLEEVSDTGGGTSGAGDLSPVLIAVIVFLAVVAVVAVGAVIFGIYKRRSYREKHRAPQGQTNAGPVSASLGHFVTDLRHTPPEDNNQHRRLETSDEEL